MSQGKIVYDGSVPAFMAKAEAKQEMQIVLPEALTQNLELGDGLQIAAGAFEANLNVQPQEITKVLSKISAHTQIKTLKIQEADFEEVIRAFLEKESRIFPSRSHH
jgi:ABC-type uncharacterized transport system ATPase subunit